MFLSNAALRVVAYEAYECECWLALLVEKVAGVLEVNVLRVVRGNRLPRRVGGTGWFLTRGRALARDHEWAQWDLYNGRQPCRAAAYLVRSNGSSQAASRAAAGGSSVVFRTAGSPRAFFLGSRRRASLAVSGLVIDSCTPTCRPFCVLPGSRRQQNRHAGRGDRGRQMGLQGKA